MPVAIESPSDVFLTPYGLLRLEPTDPPSPWKDAEVAQRVAEVLAKSPIQGLLHLATTELDSALPPAAAWWREFARRYLTALCHIPDLEQTRQAESLPPPLESDLTELIEAAPPMRGGEYLDVERLRALWCDLDALVRAEAAKHPQGAGAWLRECHPLWRLVGRVTFHLADNKKNPDFPFAFMASYGSRLTLQGRVQHLPLGRALEEYAGGKNKQALISLLAPVQRAAEKSALIQGLVESNRIFNPLLWTPVEAYRFLKDVPFFDEAGVLVRLPDWWKGGRPPRPRVSVQVGSKRVSGLGAETLLDFSAELTLEGEPLTEQEWQELLHSTDGLSLVRGKWVEVDSKKLQEALAHWKKVEKMSREDGLSFFEGMRLISGFPSSDARTDLALTEAADRDWSGIQAGPWLEDVLAELRDPARSSAPEEIPGLRAQLRPYQAVGVNWLWFLSRLGLGGCLADDMGLGKTVQVLALLLRRKSHAPERRLPNLLVVPASLLGNWRSEIERFAPSLTFAIVHPSEPDSMTGSSASPACLRVDLVITTYGLLARLEDLRKQPWDLAILDEAQAIKNPGTRQSQAVKELKTSGRFALTGTPVENRASDLWSIFDFLNPGLLGSARAFAQFTRVRDDLKSPNYAPLRAITRPYVLRRLKTDRRVISDLPDKTEMRAWCSLTKTQAVLYQKSVTEMAEALENSDGIQRKGQVLAFIMRFKQICNHPSQWLNDGGYAPELSGKFTRLRELTEEIAERQEKALIFTQFREMTGPLSGFLTEIFQQPGLVLHGGTSVPQRRKWVEAFQREDGPPFFVLTVKAGGAGLNLTQAAHVIHFDRWWNPAVENQATDRAFRIGQTKNVLVHKFVCRGTIEERIDQVIEDKKSISTELLEGGGEKLLTEMSNGELLRFVALDLQRATAS